MAARDRLYQLVDSLPEDLIAGAERLLSEPGFRPLLRQLGEAPPVRTEAATAHSESRPDPAAAMAIPFTMMDEVLFDFYFKDGGR